MHVSASGPKEDASITIKGSSDKMAKGERIFSEQAKLAPQFKVRMVRTSGGTSVSMPPMTQKRWDGIFRNMRRKRKKDNGKGKGKGKKK